ncbi:cysteine dioxygenase [Sphingomonas sp. CGMCC 1.13654]|uniref:Cysteine dioxygenase n=1 Tax=Sphingomonas chungangi TaxID=2683589 RepID=A0A838L274_9SPHN|nr:cysteine dioxygenase [Sphingomonas chungangi]MVW57829.1 cysteine dioxygenase [Sphingomonas chungangi]
MPLRRFVRDFAELLDGTSEESFVLGRGSRLLGSLIDDDRWLPDSHAAPAPDRYRQYLLHADPAGRFSVVSFVWGPGQRTPIHDHTVWGLVGVLRGAEVSESFELIDERLRSLGEQRLGPGAIDIVSPSVGDLHRVSNALDDAVSISIHVYGADIGTVERSVYDVSGRPKPFISGYSPAPNLQL